MGRQLRLHRQHVPVAVQAGVPARSSSDHPMSHLYRMSHPQSAHPDDTGSLPARARLDPILYALLLVTINKLQPEIRTDANEE